MYFAAQKNIWRVMPYGKQKQINLAVDVAKTSADLIWGGGYDVISTDDSDSELIKKIAELNSFNEMFYTNEMDLSQRGNLFATVEIVNGMPVVITDDPRNISSVGVSYVTKEVAVLFKNVIIDARAYPIKEVWDKQEVNRFWVDANGGMISTDVVVKKLPAAEQVPMKWRHGMGYVPVVHFRNRPGAHRMYSQPDDFNTGCLNQWYNSSLRTLNEVEVMNNVTKIYGAIDKKTEAQLRREAKKLGITPEMLFKSKSAIVDTKFSGDKAGNKDAVPPIQLIQGKLPAKEWHSHIKNTKKAFFESCGYSYQDPDKQSGIGGASGMDVIFTNKADVETTKAKLSTRQPEINELLKIIKDMVNKHGVGFISGELSIDIKTSLALDSSGEVEKAAKKLEMGTTSRVRVVMKLELVSRQEAEEIIAEADADAEAKAQMEQDMVMEQIQSKASDSERAK